MRGTLEATRGGDVVFADPDNGLNIEAGRPHHKRGPKYAFFTEPYLDRGQNLGPV